MPFLLPEWRAEPWRLGLPPNRTPAPDTPTYVEIFAKAGHDAAATGFALARLGKSAKPVMWVQDRMAAIEAGRPYARGIFGFAPLAGIIHVCARTAGDVLWTMEEALRCGALSAVVGELSGTPAALDFTATRRLAVAAEASGVDAVLLRFAGREGLSGARQRWRIASAASAPHPFDTRAPGQPRWSAELFRARGLPPGEWTASHDRTAHRLDLAPPLRDRAVGEAAAGRGHVIASR